MDGSKQNLTNMKAHSNKIKSQIDSLYLFIKLYKNIFILLLKLNLEFLKLNIQIPLIYILTSLRISNHNAQDYQNCLKTNQYSYFLKNQLRNFLN